MDRIRLGRVLGAGAREAAKTVVRAADAAAAPNPGAKARQAESSAPKRAPAASEGLKRGGRRLGESVWRPVARAGGVVWLEVTGLFFGLFALTAGVEVWKRRAELHGSGVGHDRVWFAVVMLVVFGYFAVSSFAKARRRGRA